MVLWVTTTVPRVTLVVVAAVEKSSFVCSRISGGFIAENTLLEKPQICFMRENEKLSPGW